ncbi:hypothetical protein BESB_007130 [Besnoitia besnoiti]|uniref:Uncharacterized protein n=1 Tax=Besnoitia besnoiti TaxID=94643 RepID=A0A2A9MQP2_BESBE|nr:hypothetical protein BESB_007130 [Besnoitia besnoiti]PFH38372.1 hypothetical protein BESB_007130 [Besnoitia besnoiti]
MTTKRVYTRPPNSQAPRDQSQRQNSPENRTPPAVRPEPRVHAAPAPDEAAAGGCPQPPRPCPCASCELLPVPKEAVCGGSGSASRSALETPCRGQAPSAVERELARPLTAAPDDQSSLSQKPRQQSTDRREKQREGHGETLGAALRGLRAGKKTQPPTGYVELSWPAPEPEGAQAPQQALNTWATLESATAADSPRRARAFTAAAVHGERRSAWERAALASSKARRQASFPRSASCAETHAPETAVVASKSKASQAPDVLSPSAPSERPFWKTLKSPPAPPRRRTPRLPSPALTSGSSGAGYRRALERQLTVLEHRLAEFLGTLASAAPASLAAATAAVAAGPPGGTDLACPEPDTEASPAHTFRCPQRGGVSPETMPRLRGLDHQVGKEHTTENLGWSGTCTPMAKGRRAAPRQAPQCAYSDDSEEGSASLSAGPSDSASLWTDAGDCGGAPLAFSPPTAPQEWRANRVDTGQRGASPHLLGLLHREQPPQDSIPSPSYTVCMRPRSVCAPGSEANRWAAGGGSSCRGSPKSSGGASQRATSAEGPSAGGLAMASFAGSALSGEGPGAEGPVGRRQSGDAHARSSTDSRSGARICRGDEDAEGVSTQPNGATAFRKRLRNATPSALLAGLAVDCSRGGGTSPSTSSPAAHPRDQRPRAGVGEPQICQRETTHSREDSDSMPHQLAPLAASTSTPCGTGLKWSGDRAARGEASDPSPLSPLLTPSAETGGANFSLSSPSTCSLSSRRLFLSPALSGCDEWPCSSLATPSTAATYTHDASTSPALISQDSARAPHLKGVGDSAESGLKKKKAAYADAQKNKLHTPCSALSSGLTKDHSPLSSEDGISLRSSPLLSPPLASTRSLSSPSVQLPSDAPSRSRFSLLRLRRPPASCGDAGGGSSDTQPWKAGHRRRQSAGLIPRLAGGSAAPEKAPKASTGYSSADGQIRLQLFQSLLVVLRCLDEVKSLRRGAEVFATHGAASPRPLHQGSGGVSPADAVLAATATPPREPAGPLEGEAEGRRDSFACDLRGVLKRLADVASTSVEAAATAAALAALPAPADARSTWTPMRGIAHRRQEKTPRKDEVSCRFSAAVFAVSEAAADAAAWAARTLEAERESRSPARLFSVNRHGNGDDVEAINRSTRAGHRLAARSHSQSKRSHSAPGRVRGRPTSDCAEEETAAQKTAGDDGGGRRDSEGTGRRVTPRGPKGGRASGRQGRACREVAEACTASRHKDGGTKSRSLSTSGAFGRNGHSSGPSHGYALKLSAHQTTADRVEAPEGVPQRSSEENGIHRQRKRALALLEGSWVIRLLPPACGEEHPSPARDSDGATASARYAAAHVLRALAGMRRTKKPDSFKRGRRDSPASQGPTCSPCRPGGANKATGESGEAPCRLPKQEKCFLFVSADFGYLCCAAAPPPSVVRAAAEAEEADRVWSSRAFEVEEAPGCGPGETRAAQRAGEIFDEFAPGNSRARSDKLQRGRVRLHHVESLAGSQVKLPYVHSRRWMPQKTGEADSTQGRRSSGSSEQEGQDETHTPGRVAPEDIHVSDSSMSSSGGRGGDSQSLGAQNACSTGSLHALRGVYGSASDGASLSSEASRLSPSAPGWGGKSAEAAQSPAAADCPICRGGLQETGLGASRARKAMPARGSAATAMLPSSGFPRGSGQPRREVLGFCRLSHSTLRRPHARDHARRRLAPVLAPSTCAWGEAKTPHSRVLLLGAQTTPRGPRAQSADEKKSGGAALTDTWDRRERGREAADAKRSGAGEEADTSERAVTTRHGDDGNASDASVAPSVLCVSLPGFAPCRRRQGASSRQACRPTSLPANARRSATRGRAEGGGRPAAGDRGLFRKPSEGEANLQPPAALRRPSAISDSGLPASRSEAREGGGTAKQRSRRPVEAMRDGRPRAERRRSSAESHERRLGRASDCDNMPPREGRRRASASDLALPLSSFSRDAWQLVLPLSAIDSLEYGYCSHAYRVLQQSKCAPLLAIPPYLCWSVRVRASRDGAADTEREAESRSGSGTLARQRQSGHQSSKRRVSPRDASKETRRSPLQRACGSHRNCGERTERAAPTISNPTKGRHAKQSCTTLDFIVLSEEDAAKWVVSLNGLIRHSPLRVLFTAEEFSRQLRVMRMHHMQRLRLEFLLAHTSLCAGGLQGKATVSKLLSDGFLPSPYFDFTAETLTYARANTGSSAHLLLSGGQRPVSIRDSTTLRDHSNLAAEILALHCAQTTSGAGKHAPDLEEPISRGAENGDQFVEFGPLGDDACCRHQNPRGPSGAHTALDPREETHETLRGRRLRTGRCPSSPPQLAGCGSCRSTTTGSSAEYSSGEDVPHALPARTPRRGLPLSRVPGLLAQDDVASDSHSGAVRPPVYLASFSQSLARLDPLQPESCDATELSPSSLSPLSMDASAELKHAASRCLTCASGGGKASAAAARTQRTSGSCHRCADIRAAAELFVRAVRTKSDGATALGCASYLATEAQTPSRILHKRKDEAKTTQMPGREAGVLRQPQGSRWTWVFESSSSQGQAAEAGERAQGQASPSRHFFCMQRPFHPGQLLHGLAADSTAGSAGRDEANAFSSLDSSEALTTRSVSSKGVSLSAASPKLETGIAVEPIAGTVSANAFLRDGHCPVLPGHAWAVAVPPAATRSAGRCRRDEMDSVSANQRPAASAGEATSTGPQPRPRPLSRRPFIGATAVRAFLSLVQRGWGRRRDTCAGTDPRSAGSLGVPLESWIYEGETAAGGQHPPSLPCVASQCTSPQPCFALNCAAAMCPLSASAAAAGVQAHAKEAMGFPRPTPVCGSYSGSCVNSEQSAWGHTPRDSFATVCGLDFYAHENERRLCMRNGGAVAREISKKSQESPGEGAALARVFDARPTPASGCHAAKKGALKRSSSFFARRRSSEKVTAAVEAKNLQRSASCCAGEGWRPHDSHSLPQAPRAHWKWGVSTNSRLESEQESFPPQRCNARRGEARGPRRPAGKECGCLPPVIEPERVSGEKALASLPHYGSACAFSVAPAAFSVGMHCLPTCSLEGGYPCMQWVSYPLASSLAGARPPAAEFPETDGGGSWVTGPSQEEGPAAEWVRPLCWTFGLPPPHPVHVHRMHSAGQATGSELFSVDSAEASRDAGSGEGVVWSGHVPPVLEPGGGEGTGVGVQAREGAHTSPQHTPNSPEASVSVHSANPSSICPPWASGCRGQSPAAAAGGLAVSRADAAGIGVDDSRQPHDSIQNPAADSSPRLLAEETQSKSLATPGVADDDEEEVQFCIFSEEKGT